MYLHRHFKVDANCQGLGTFSVKCFQTNETDFQYGWIKIVDAIPVQICALVQLEMDTPQGLGNILLYVGLQCKYIDGHVNGVHPPFPVITYSMEYNRRGSLVPSVVADTVDGIFEPAFVVPTKGGSKDFVLQRPALMQKSRFYVPPLQYLLRDGYSDMNFENQLNNAIRTDAMTRKYLRSTKEQKQRMYAQLLETLESNGDNPEDDLENFHI